MPETGTLGALAAVLFDFGDTLFERRSGPAGLVEAAAALGARVDPPRAAELWDRIQRAARMPEELARGRDLSPAAHRREWTRLYSAADVIAPGLGEALYAREIDPATWLPFPDTREVVERLSEAGVRLGVVSDTGWDVRTVFERHGLGRFFRTFVLSFERGTAKPAARLFTAACAELEVAPDAALMVGDNPLTDGGAVGAGVPALILPLAPPGGRRGLDAVLRLAGLA